MLTVVTDVCDVCLLHGLNQRQCVQCMLYAMYVGSFGAAFAKCIWPLVNFYVDVCVLSFMWYDVLYNYVLQPEKMIAVWMQEFFDVSIHTCFCYVSSNP